MQLTDALCYALLTITMTATCIQAEDRRHDLEERKLDRRLNRREATLLIDSISAERTFHKPKVLYRKVSKQRYGPPKYRPQRPNYGPPKTSRKPTKKNKGKVSQKYGPPSYKKRAQRPRYGSSKRPQTNPVYGPPKKKHPHSFSANTYQPEPMGFGEPPLHFDDLRSPKPDYDDYQNYQKPGDFQKSEFDKHRKPSISDFQQPSFSNYHKPRSSDFHKPESSDFHKPDSIDFHKQSFDGFQKQNFDEFPPKQGYGEPPVDSYGAPIKPNLHDLTYPTALSYPESSSHSDQDTFDSSFQSWKSFQQDQNLDNKYAFSKNRPAFTKPDNDVFVPSKLKIPEDAEEELGLNSYSDIYNYRQMKDEVKRKPYRNLKIVNQPWKGNHKKQIDDDIIVGGQYAEPPARYVPKFQPSAPMFTDEDEFAPPGHLTDPELVASATNSPYVNYKNSNMAFSPQNLNDAFSIVDK